MRERPAPRLAPERRDHAALERALRRPGRRERRPRGARAPPRSRRAPRRPRAAPPLAAAPDPRGGARPRSSASAAGGAPASASSVAALRASARSPRWRARIAASSPCRRQAAPPPRTPRGPRRSRATGGRARRRSPSASRAAAATALPDAASDSSAAATSGAAAAARSASAGEARHRRRRRERAVHRRAGGDPARDRLHGRGLVEREERGEERPRVHALRLLQQSRRLGAQRLAQRRLDRRDRVGHRRRSGGHGRAGTGRAQDLEPRLEPAPREQLPQRGVRRSRARRAPIRAFAKSRRANSALPLRKRSAASSASSTGQARSSREGSVSSRTRRPTTSSTPPRAAGAPRTTARAAVAGSSATSARAHLGLGAGIDDELDRPPARLRQDLGEQPRVEGGSALPREPREGLVAQLLEQPAPLDEQRSVPLDRDRLERGAPPRASPPLARGRAPTPATDSAVARGLGDDPLALPLRRGAHLARLARGLLLEDAQELRVAHG